MSRSNGASGFWAWIIALFQRLKPATSETIRQGQWYLLDRVRLNAARARLAEAEATAAELENIEKAIEIEDKLRSRGKKIWLSLDGNIPRLHTGSDLPKSDEISAVEPSADIVTLEVMEVRSAKREPTEDRAGATPDR